MAAKKRPDKSGPKLSEQDAARLNGIERALRGGASKLEIVRAIQAKYQLSADQALAEVERVAEEVNTLRTAGTLPSLGKQSGAQGRKKAKAAESAEQERERDRIGITEEWDKLLDIMGPPPVDPLETSEWANQMAANMAYITARDASLPMGERFKRVSELIDRIAGTFQKATTAKRIREIKEATGLAKPKGKHADGSITVGSGPSLRARSGAFAGASVPRPVSELPPEGGPQKGRGDSSGRRPVGPDKPPVH